MSLFAAMFAGKMPHLEGLSNQQVWWAQAEIHVIWQTFGCLLSSLTILDCYAIEFKTYDSSLGAFLRRSRKLAVLYLMRHTQS